MHAIINFLFLPNKVKLINKTNEDKNTKKKAIAGAFFVRTRNVTVLVTILC